MLGSEGERERECHLVGLPSPCGAAIGVGWSSCHGAAIRVGCLAHHGAANGTELPSVWICCHPVGLPSSPRPTISLSCCPAAPHDPTALQAHRCALRCGFEAPGFQRPPVFECCSDDGCCSFCSPSILELLLQKCQSGKCTLGV